MKKYNLTYIFTGLLLLISISISASNPINLEAALQKLFPNATNVQWSKNHGYDIATFIENQYGINVWFTNKGEWIMTEKDVNSLEAIPEIVAQKFMSSTLSAGRLRYIRVIDLPKQEPPVIVIDVQSWNSPEEFQVFYSPDGTLLQTLNVTDTGGIIYPGLFN